MSPKQRQWQGQNRRQTAPQNDRLYRLLIALSLSAWALFVVAMLLFHYARPELQTGFMQALGMQSEQDWHRGLSGWLLLTLSCSVFFSIVALIIRKRRARRRQDGLWLNLIILALLSLLSLGWLLLFAD
ncbi:hypothetical protein GCM10009092_08330 [Bowmanella denitrificans]|uniref:Uncharacterized protein n=1 Tax=Bowmanella denitrificans TaxID=366582 RepID=A0ABP3GJ42_9ALTE|nr:hypothetical protein [Bowmanella denitrificans]